MINKRKIIVEKKVSDKKMIAKKGTFINSTRGYTLIDKDVDIYKKNGEILIIYRKKLIPEHLKKIAIDNLRDATLKPSFNRGIASGPIDIKKMGKILNRDVKKLVKVSKFKAIGIKKDGSRSNYQWAMPTYGNIVGWYDTKGEIKPTVYTKKNPKKFKKSYPFFQWVNDKYKQLAPEPHKEVMKKTKGIKKYVVPKTYISTITVNRDFRTAIHKDKNDEGKLGNLSVFHTGKVDGGYLLFPQYKIGVKMADRDFAIMDVHEYHTNTKISGNGERMSFVMYLRSNIIKNK